MVDHPSSLQIFLGTWNVNGKPCKTALDPWLSVEKGEKPDLFVLGFQEFDLTKESFQTFNEERLNNWRKYIQDSISKTGNYKEVAVQQFVGMMIIVFASENIASQISEIDSNLVGCGYNGYMGNKGGVGVRFKFGGESFCFINSHLNAHVHKVERRNTDYKSICSRMVFHPNGTSNKPQVSMDMPEGVSEEDPADSESEIFTKQPETSLLELKEGELRIFDHDHVFWIGDLNYRVELPRQQIIDCIDANDWDTLLDADQLRIQMSKGKSFQNFTEPKIQFRPTYKFDSGTDNFDSSPKMRLPAYCDRVMWKNDNSIESIFYRSHLDPKFSDHKPVSALVNVSLKNPTTPTPSSSKTPSNSTTNNFHVQKSTDEQSNTFTFFLVGGIVLALVYYIFFKD